MHLKASSCFLLFGLIAAASAVPAGYGGRQRVRTGPSPYAAVQRELEEPQDEYEVEEAPARDYSRSSYSQSPQYKMDSDRIAEEQNKNAKYAFASAVDDGIMDQSQVRQEVRDGTKVSGSYSYSDGFFRRTVKYEADEMGYRVVGEEVEPIGDGPQMDLVNGKADVHSQVEGINTQYSISADEIRTMGGRDTHMKKTSH